VARPAGVSCAVVCWRPAHPLDRATRARAGAAFRQKLLASPEFRQQWEANQRSAKRQRGRPHADALRALPPEAFAVLEEPARELVRRYYGLGDAGPETQRMLAARFHMDGSRLSGLLRTSVSRLLAVSSRDTETGPVGTAPRGTGSMAQS
jgi:hypothetical protein